MKRFIMIFVSFCILIMICSCHQSLPELPNGGDTTVVNDPDAQETTGLPTQEGQAEETTERMVETEPVIGGDMPSLIIDSESDYQKFMAQCKELPENFVAYEDLAIFGAFQVLTFSVFGDYEYYLYTLKDSTGFVLQISVDHTPNQNESVQILAFESNAQDLRRYSSGNEGLEVYSKGELRYYYASGDLIRISWVQDQIEYCVMGGFEADLSAYPQNATDTVLSGLLSYQTAENTYSTLFSEK